METLRKLIADLNADSTFDVAANDATLQFEAGSRQLLFSSVLPERTTNRNEFRDSSIKFKTMIADDATRYSPPVYKNGMLTGTVMVELGDSDIASRIQQQQYEAFIEMIERDITQEALATLMRFFQSTIAEPLAILREKHRVDAISKGYVERKGANGFEEIVRFLSPAGHRVTVPSGTTGTPAGWYSPTYSILDDLTAIKEMLQAKGYMINRVITTPEIINKCFMKNEEIRQWGLITLNAPGGGTAVTLQTRTNDTAVANALQSIGFPQPEVYTEGYNDQVAYHFFLENKFIILCRTGRDASVNLGEATPLILPDTFGYTSIGRATGQLAAGVRTKVESFDGKDARIEAYGWQTSFPVINEPEAYAVFTIPKPA